MLAEVPEEHFVGGAGFRGFGHLRAFRDLELELLFEGQRGAQELIGLGDFEAQGGGERVAGIEEIRRQAEHFFEKDGEVGDARSSVFAVDDGARRAEREEALLELRRRLVRASHALVGENGGGKDEAFDGLDHPQPRLVHASKRVTHRATSSRWGR